MSEPLKRFNFRSESTAHYVNCEIRPDGRVVHVAAVRDRLQEMFSAWTSEDTRNDSDKRLYDAFEQLLKELA